MTDIVSPKKRSEMMSGITGKNTSPEQSIRRMLFSHGYRYRLHVRELPGKPDIVLRKYQCVIFINGCFWHKHNCHLFKWPSTNKEFWKDKLSKNHARDKNNQSKLINKGWNVVVIWECALKGKNKLSEDELIAKLSTVLNSKNDISSLKDITGINNI